MKGRIAILATMDTKGAESAYLRDQVAARGHEPLLVDIGSLGPPTVEPDIPSKQVARMAGWRLEQLCREKARDQIMETLGGGAAKVLIGLLKEDKLSGVIGLGGNQGSAVASMAMRALPIGFPKLLISTVASGNIRPYIGHKDILVICSVSDLLGGPNAVTRTILTNAASALLGMVEHGRHISLQQGERTVAISALGNTQPAVSRAMQRLQQEGYQVIAFHASGAGGSAMEELVEAGFINGVLDITPHELIEEVLGTGIYIPVTPGRLSAAGRKGIPQVVSTGGLEYLCFGPRSSIPGRLRKRKIYMHNPYNANVKASRGEMVRVGQVMAQRLNQARGPTAIIIPGQGWSVYGSPGGPFFDPPGNRMLVEALKQHLKEGIPLELVDAHINDADFVDRCVTRFLEYLGGRHDER